MSEMGGPSQVRDEEPRDIGVVWEQMVQREPTPLITVVSPEHELESEPEEEPEEESEEDPEEVPLTSIDVGMYDALYDRNVELQDKVRDLEELADIRQAVIEQKNEEVQELEVCFEEVKEDLVREKSDKEKLLAEVENLKKSLIEETAKRTKAEDAWMKVTQRVEYVEDKVRTKKARINEVSYALHSAIDRAQDRIFYHPDRVENVPWYMLNRRTMICVMEEERREAVRRLNMFRENE